jgi:dTDP-4-amino-4,6-dideoxygalactose transaminase
LSVFDNIEKKFIAINEELKLEISDIKKFLEDKNLRGVVLIDYFGLSNLQPYIECIKSVRPDVLIIVDAVQAFLSIVLSDNHYPGADVVISSPRKFLPISDGGLVIFNNKKPIYSFSKNNNLNDQASYYVSAGILKDAILKNSFDDETFLNIESLYLNLFDRHRKLFNNEIEPISNLSLELIKRTNLKAIVNKRLINFKWMSDVFKQNKYENLLSPIFNDSTGPGIVFPLRVDSKHRDPLRAYLKSRGIFCPVHWPILKSQLPLLGKSSMLLSKEILGLPIDQRYDENDLSRILNEIDNYIKVHKI